MKEISEYLDFKTIGMRYGLSIDALRRAARLGRLKTTQVGGPFGAHLCLEEDVDQWLKEYPNGRKNQRRSKEPRLMSLR